MDYIASSDKCLKFHYRISQTLQFDQSYSKARCGYILKAAMMKINPNDENQPQLFRWFYIWHCPDSRWSDM